MIIDKNVHIKKGERLNGGVNAVKVKGESMKVVNRMCPYHEDVVYVIAPPFS